MTRYNEEEVKEAARLINESERPIVYFGGGVRSAEDARALSAEIEADIKALELEDPELAARVKKMVDDELKAIDSPEPKAVDAAMRCLINE